MLTESITAPIVVRGRSPRNFQARKEIPLLGSSAGSRGQALVETGVGVIASALSVKSEAKRGGSLDMQVPRSAFTFTSPKPQTAQGSGLRSKYVYHQEMCHLPTQMLISSGNSSYPSWNQQTGSLHQLPATTMSMPSASAFASESHDPLATSIAAPSASLSQYAPTAGALASENVPRYVDNGRSTKSPRHQGQSSVHGSIAASDTSTDYRYGSYRMSVSGASDAGPASYATESGVQSGGAGRDYYPSTTNSWTTSAAEPSSSLAYANPDRPYAFDRPTGMGTKQEATLPTGALYGSNNKGAFESMSNYSWSTN